MRLMRLFRCFHGSDAGFVLSTESLLLGTIGVLGLIVGLAEVRNAAVQELGDFSQAVAFLSQDYAYTSVTSTNVSTNIQTSGATYVDDADTQRTDTDAANGVVVATAADVE
ncbi:MAG: hypothetical protein WCK86_09505 [Planctomycetia bacterium]